MSTQTQSNATYEVVSRHGIADVWYNSEKKNRSVHAVARFNPGDTIINFFAGTTQNFPTYLTVQTASDTHITLDPMFLQYINHSCDPNVFFDTKGMRVVCLRQIEPSDELCFFYPSAEWEMAQPFVCDCGSEHCLRLINGAAHLDAETLSKYRLTDFILQQVQKNL